MTPADTKASLPEVPDDIRGWATLKDGCRVELSKEECEQMWKSADDAKNRRAELMPTEQDAINLISDAVQRLKELGWREAIYCPKDGTMFDAIEAGSTGIHDCAYHGEWPNGTWNIYDDGDIWPSHPILYRRKT